MHGLIDYSTVGATLAAPVVAAVAGSLGAAVPALPWLLGFAGHRKRRNHFSV